MKKIVFIGIFWCFFSEIAFGQFDRLIKKGLEKGKKVAENSVNKERDHLDSVDFNYAISVIDNSGMMNIRDLNEQVMRTASTGLSVTKDDSKKTDAERAHEALDLAETFYQSRKFKVAELYFLDAKLL
ncbi:hypothetical protein BH10BAC4_BH10BAC4_11740 [soil metagenome]